MDICVLFLPVFPFYSNILIYPLNIHLHVASNFACVRLTFLIFIYMYVTLFPRSVHTYVRKCVLNVCTYVMYDYHINTWVQFIVYSYGICRFIYNFDQLIQPAYGP